MVDVSGSGQGTAGGLTGGGGSGFADEVGTGGITGGLEVGSGLYEVVGRTVGQGTVVVMVVVITTTDVEVTTTSFGGLICLSLIHI